MDESHASAPQPEPQEPDTAGAARLMVLGTGPAVLFDRLLPGEPEQVWRALTEPDGLRGWFPCSIEAERWRVGAALTFRFPGNADFSTEGVVLECEPPRVLAYLWGEETLRFELVAAGGPDASGASAATGGSADERGTRLVMTDELAAPIAARNAAGWHLCLDRLAGNAPAPGEDAWRRLFAAYRAAFEPALGPQEGPPAGFEQQA